MIDSFFWRRFIARRGLARWVPAWRRQAGGADGVLHHYSDRTLALPVDQLHDPALMPSATTPGSIDLALSAPQCEIALSLGRGLNDRRPTPAWGDLELRADLAEEFQRTHGVEHDPREEVLVTHGGSGAFASALDAFVNPGDAAVLFDPTSPMFAIGLRHRRARVRWVPTWGDAGRVRFAMDAFAKAVRGAKMVVLADPCNPTGCVLAPEDLEQIAFWAWKHDVLIYQDLSFDRWRDKPAAGRLASLPNAGGRTLTAGSFGKSHGLTAGRVGWLVGDRHLVRPCAGAAVMSAPFVPAVCQYAAKQMLRIIDGTREEMQARRDAAAGRLRAMGLSPVEPAAGFFLWTPIPTAEASRPFAQDLLRRTGVLVNPGAVFGPGGDNYFRLSVAADEGRLREGLQRIEGALVGQPEPVAAGH